MHLLGSEDRQSLRTIGFVLMGFLLLIGLLIAIAVTVG